MAFLGLGVMILILRWAFSRGGSVVAKPPRMGNPDQYGLLVPVASPGNYIDGEMLRQALEQSGIRANLAQTNEGPRVMVFPRDEQKAREILSRGPQASRG